VAPEQRVIFFVYDENEERTVRAKVDELELITRKADHQWASYDLSDSFAIWLASQRYAKSYFQQPHKLFPLLPRFLDFIATEFKSFLVHNDADENTVVSLLGTGSLFGFLKIRELVDKLAPMVPGRLLVLFPGICENNNYRLLNAYDGWNYRAIPITEGKDF